MNIDSRISHDDEDVLVSASHDVNILENGIHVAPSQSDAHERWTKMPRARGRQPRDPDAHSIEFSCRGVEELETQLRDYLSAPTGPPEHTTLEFTFAASAAFMVYTSDLKGKRNVEPGEKPPQHLYGKLDRSAVSIIDALAAVEDPKEQMRRQKAIAKICVETCERCDGYRYSFHNHWLSREDEACRFSYFCNDSTLNKGRAANEGAGMAGKRMRKPVYNCQGLIAVKFSAVKQNLEVHYKHIPVHKTYVERAPPPRKDSKRYKLMQIFNPESLPPEKTRTKSSTAPASNARKRRATETPAVSDLQHPVKAPSENGLHPLVEFLQSTDHADHESLTSGIETGAADTLSKATRPPRPVTAGSKKHQQSTKAHTKRARRPALPGTLNGALQSGSLTWTAPKDTSVMTTQENSATLQGIAEAAASVSGAISLSELDILKAKLEEAEQRIRRLEAEKQQTLAPTSGLPAWSGYPPPNHYPYPYPPTSYSYQPQTAAPPQRYASFPTYPHSSYPNPQAVSQTQQTDLTKKKGGAKEKRSGVRAFVPYTPKAQKPVLDAQRQDTSRQNILIDTENSIPDTVEDPPSVTRRMRDDPTRISTGMVRLASGQVAVQRGSSVSVNSSHDHQGQRQPADSNP